MKRSRDTLHQTEPVLESQVTFNSLPADKPASAVRFARWGLILLMLLSLCAMPLINGCGSETKAPRTMIIAVDGADWSIIRPLISSGKLPHIQSLLINGSHGPLWSIEPLTAPATWTSVATGQKPDKHGIFDYFVIDPATDQLSLATTDYRRQPAFWTLLSNYGLSVAVIGWQSSWPAEKVRGLVVSDRLIGSDFSGLTPPEYGLVYPEEQEAEIRDLLDSPENLPYQIAAEFIDLLESEYSTVTDPLVPDELSRFRASCQSMRNAVEITKHVVQTNNPDLVAVRLDGLETIQHLFVRHMPPVLAKSIESDRLRYQNTVLAFYEYLDRLLGELLSCTNDRTNVLFVSNHGCKSGESRPVIRRDFIDIPPATLFRRREGVFLMKGPDIKSAAANSNAEQIFVQAQLTDITATIIALAGLSVPENLNGRPLTELFSKEPQALQLDFELIPPELHLDQPAVISTSPEADEELTTRLIQFGHLSSGASKKIYNQTLNREADYYMFNENLANAIEVLEQLCAGETESTTHFVRLADVYIQNKQWSNARYTLARAMAIQPANIELQMKMAFVYRELNNYVKAIELLKRASLEHPSHVGVHVNIGMLYKEMKQYTKAENAINEALAKNPDHHTAHVQMALLHEREREFDLALTHWQEAVRIRPGDRMSHQHIESLNRRGFPSKDN